METNVIVSPDHPVPLSTATHHEIQNSDRGRTAGHCQQFQSRLLSPVRPVVGSTSCASCVDCQQEQQLQDQQHHYHEIGQNPPPSATSRPAVQRTVNHPPCDIPTNVVMQPSQSCCCCAVNSAPATGPTTYFQPHQSHHRHQNSIPESDSGSLVGPRPNPATRSCRGPVLSSSTENLQSGCESQYSRRKKSHLRKKSKPPLNCRPEDVISLHSKSSRDVPTPSTANIQDEMGSAKYSNQIEIYSEEVGNGTIKSEVASDIEVVGPPLPPRLPMRPARVTENVPPPSPGVRKYVLWCLLCGGAAGLLGIMFLGVYFLIRNYTSSLTYFETVPTFVPSTLLILTGLCIMSLARRRNRYTFLIKLSGACGLASALICALQTVTTTALHMSRLQGLKECEYQSKTKTCTCYTIHSPNSEMMDSNARFVFDSIEDCGMVHGALYSCLRALFGLSVVGVLVAVISCMLVYQLLSHERKKMYWEQLELRCRSLYNGQPPPPHGLATIGQAGAPIIDPNRCRCCEQCHAHGLPTPAAYPWHTESAGIRFWTGPAGNFYSPNPGGEDMRMTMTGSGIRTAQNGGRIHPEGGAGNAGASSGWSWPRMPWQRNEPNRFRHPAATPSSPDSQYGFSNNQVMDGQLNQPNGGYSVIGSSPYGVWGPPPPYSDPNSPARRNGTGRYQYIQSPGGANNHQHHQQPQSQQSLMMTMHNDGSMGSLGMNMGSGAQVGVMGNNNVRQSQMNVVECHHQHQQQQQQQLQNQQVNQLVSQSHHQPPQQIHSSCGGVGGQNLAPEGPRSLELIYPQQQSQQQPPHQNNERRNFGKQFPSNKDFYENGHNHHHQHTVECDATMTTIHRHDTNSLPTRKTKKRVEAAALAGAMTVGLNAPTPRVNVQDVFNVEAVGVPPTSMPRTTASGIEVGGQVGVQQDNLYEETAQQQAQPQTRLLVAEQDEEKDYLAQRFGNREASVRSRMPFPQNSDAPEVVMPLPPMVRPRKSLLMNKETTSRHSMCSLDSDAEPKTEITDLSPNTPSAAMNLNEFHANFDQTQPQGVVGGGGDWKPESNFVASFPYSSTDHSQEAVRRPTPKVPISSSGPIPPQDVNQTPQYEVIPEHVSRVPKGTTYLGHHVGQGNSSSSNVSSGGGGSSNQIGGTHLAVVGAAGMRSPKNLKMTPIKRRNISTDISTIIHGSDVSLMYQDRRSGVENFNASLAKHVGGDDGDDEHDEEEVDDDEEGDDDVGARL